MYVQRTYNNIYPIYIESEWPSREQSGERVGIFFYSIHTMPYVCTVIYEYTHIHIHITHSHPQYISLCNIRGVYGMFNVLKSLVY